MAAGMTVAGISGREHGSGSKRSFPRRISARCRCHPPPSVAPPFARQPAAEHGHGAEPPVRLSHGHVDKEMMAREQITPSELIKALRREGHTSLTKIRNAVLENDGSITVGTRLQR